MRILVSGGAGYIGSVLVPRLLVGGHQVTVVDNFMFGQTSLAALCAYSNLEIVRGDARDDRVLRSLVARSDVIIPLAALVGAPICEADMIGASSTNVAAIDSLAGMMSENQMLIVPISNSGYGIGEPGKYCTEDTPMRPVSHYGATKVQAEKIVLRVGGVSLRLATVFGASPRMRMDLLVNDFVWRAVRDRAIVLFEGSFRRNFLHVRDAARAFEHAIQRYESMKGRAYNVGLSDANLTKIELCERIANRVPGFMWTEAKIGEDKDKRDYFVSNKRIEDTGFRTIHTLDGGIDELVKCYQMMRGVQYGNA